MSGAATTTPTVRALLQEALRALPQAEARLEAEILLAHVLDVSRTWLYAHAADGVASAQVERYRVLLAARTAGQPIAYLTGKREFWSLPLQVTPDTLIPRADTELLVEQALLHIPHCRVMDILDLGTGSGAIALALAFERPQARVVATDLSRAALAVAHNNSQQLGISNIRFCESSWFSAIEPQHFDVIVSNPPYIRANDHHLGEGDLRFEPISALASGMDGLDAIREIVADVAHHLHCGGWLLLEHGHDQGESIRGLLLAAGLEEVTTAHDLERRERITSGRRNSPTSATNTGE
jgi:release factor glutamine methyltransferase